ncbi:MAG: tryptophan 7-halogenase [Myxococcales bacterium]|nr:tryptophan 7-halogenase [Myxococcales bacterium]
MERDREVIVVGAGPAGATAGALLASKGHDVLVLERDEFPRFHIGESLLPNGTRVHALLGIEHTPDAFRYKRGAQFLCETTDRAVSFDFAEALPGPPRNAWHVERATFDTLLRDRARAMGAEVVHGVTVRGFENDGATVRVETSAGPVTGRYLIDATGQDRLVANRKREVRPFKTFGKAAVFGHFEGLSDAAWETIGPGNDIRIMMIDDGWVWVIPLPDGRLSVGLVSRRQGMKREWLADYVASSRYVGALVKGAKPPTPRVLSNYSFRNGAPYGHRYACVGDAACFIDPVFSSGVCLAMNAAVSLADALSVALREQREGDGAFLDGHRAMLERGYETFSSLVHRFYNRNLVSNLFFGAPEEGDLRPSVVSVLAGDVWRDDSPFADMLMRSRSTPWRETERSDAAPYSLT